MTNLICVLAEASAAPSPWTVGWAGAIGAVVAALVAAIVGARTKRHSDAAIEALKARLGAGAADDDARREYRSKAKQRLYEECEPILFQLLERAEDARHRIASLARTAKQGNLGTSADVKENWLAADGYYLTSTTYYLLAPLVLTSILRRKLTAVDLNVSPRLARQYVVAKVAALALTDAYGFAAAEPMLEYDPKWDSDELPDESRIDDPVAYPQGLVLGDLEDIVESMTRTGPEGARCVTYAEFSAATRGVTPPGARLARASMGTALFRRFHPARRPVLWRVLLGQALLYDLFLRLRLSQDDRPLDGRPISDELDDWRARPPEELWWHDEGVAPLGGTEPVRDAACAARATVARLLDRVRLFGVPARTSR